MNAAPPQNLEAERAVLGSILLSDDTTLPKVLSMGLRPEDFYWTTHTTVFAAMVGMYEDRRHIDQLTLKQYTAGKVDRGEVDALAGAPFSVSHLPEYARIVIECAFLRRMRTLGLEIIAAADLGDLDALRVLVGRGVSLLPKEGLRAVGERKAA